ncbi:MAG: DUF4292 domain-containing protein [Prosthecochloris sp.]|nr:DUF4292 domain-containing protein [Prosthecochloris sp.]
MITIRGMQFFALLALMVLMSSCTEFRTVTRQEWPGEAAGLTSELALLYQEVSASSDPVRSLDGYADIWISTPRRQERVYSNIQLNRAGDMRIIISAGLLGWPVADMLFRPDSLFVHDMLNSRLLAGRNTPDNMEKILGLRSDYEFLSEALFGLVALREPIGAIESVKSGEGMVSYLVRTRSGRREVLVNPLTRQIEAMKVMNPDGRVLVEMKFSGFMTYRLEGRSVSLPRDIELVLHDQRLNGGGAHEMVIGYDERTVDTRRKTIEYRMPENVRVIDLDRLGLLPWL